MIASAHVAAGFVAGMTASYVFRRSAPRAATALVFGLATHVALDAIPHGDYAGLTQSTIQVVALCEVIGISVIAGLMLRRRVDGGWPWYLIPGVFGAAIPDVKFPARAFLSPRVAERIAAKGDYIHSFFHAAPTPARKGWTIEIIATIVLLAMLRLFPRRTT